MARNVIYQGDLEELKEKWANQYIDNGQCARLPQVLTDVGYTGRWLPGPRVVDLAFLLPGTVIANFKLVNGYLKYPNEHNYHAGLFQRYEYGRVMSNGEPCHFSMIDQWVNKRGGVGERGLAAYTPEEAKRRRKAPSDNASEFYVVVVP
ncbi:BPSL0067 family protein [Massilia horti]|uniref:Uncharacterized protein n=1 Tax=Massilia horti TaxID=2562153 RepID=A0A4Y9SYV7_9BURK|nr:BPSL0067 family protein [Massilia horti]TFW30522.1 hypothetical protein E4O92_16545 [Massilia horti]TFW30559.1 hypothetical protein E4O92_16740 [Massilia horti]